MWRERIHYLVDRLQEQMTSEYLEELFDYYRPFVYKMNSSYSLLAYDREDIIQEGWVAMMEALQSYDHDWGAPFTPYFTSIYHNRLRNVLRTSSASKRGYGQEWLPWQEDGSLVYEDPAYYTYTSSLREANLRMGQHYNPADVVVMHDLIQIYLEDLSDLEGEVFYRSLLAEDHQAQRDWTPYDQDQMRSAYNRCRKKLSVLAVDQPSRFWKPKIE